MKEPKIPKFVDDLKNYLIAIRNLSEIYVENMIVTIEQFLEFINTHKFKNKYDSIEKLTLNDIRSLTNSDIYSFIYFLAESHYKMNSRVVKTDHLRTFFNFLFNIKHTIFTEPFKKIKCERATEQKLPNYLSLDEAKKVLNAYTKNNKLADVRNKAILDLFLNAKLKLSEISKLNINNINLKENKIIVFGKKSNYKEEYLNAASIKLLDNYLKIRKELNVETDALFLSHFNKRISPDRLGIIIKDAISLSFNESFSVHTLPYNLSEEEKTKIFDTYSDNCKVTDLRNEAILHIFLNCGLRLSEVSNLNIENINMETGTFKVFGKGSKERTAYLNDITKNALEAYLKIRKEMNVKTNALFLSNYNKRLSATSIKRIVKQAYLLAGVDNEKYSAHTLRHTCATLLYRNGIDIKTIQEILGHVQVDTTQIYTHLHNEKVQSAMLGHPLSKFKIADAIGFCA